MRSWPRLGRGSTAWLRCGVSGPRISALDQPSARAAIPVGGSRSGWPAFPYPFLNVCGPSLLTAAACFFVPLPRANRARRARPPHRTPPLARPRWPTSSRRRGMWSGSRCGDNGWVVGRLRCLCRHHPCPRRPSPTVLRPPIPSAQEHILALALGGGTTPAARAAAASARRTAFPPPPASSSFEVPHAHGAASSRPVGGSKADAGGKAAAAPLTAGLGGTPASAASSAAKLPSSGDGGVGARTDDPFGDENERGDGGGPPASGDRQRLWASGGKAGVTPGVYREGVGQLQAHPMGPGGSGLDLVAAGGSEGVTELQQSAASIFSSPAPQARHGAAVTVVAGSAVDINTVTP